MNFMAFDILDCFVSCCKEHTSCELRLGWLSPWSANRRSAFPLSAGDVFTSILYSK